jgi:hypothetical protein
MGRDWPVNAVLRDLSISYPVCYQIFERDPVARHPAARWTRQSRVSVELTHSRQGNPVNVAVGANPREGVNRRIGSGKYSIPDN